MVMEGSGQQHLLFGETDLLHARREIPVVRIAIDLSVSKLDDCGTANLEGLVGRWQAGEVFRLSASPSPLQSARFSVSRHEA